MNKIIIKNNLKKLNKKLILVKYVNYPEYNNKKIRTVIDVNHTYKENIDNRFNRLSLFIKDKNKINYILQNFTPESIKIELSSFLFVVFVCGSSSYFLREKNNSEIIIPIKKKFKYGCDWCLDITNLNEYKKDIKIKIYQ